MNLPDFASKKKIGVRDLHAPKAHYQEERKIRSRKSSQDLRRPESAPKSPISKVPEPHIGTVFFEPEQVKFILNHKPMDLVVDAMSTEPGAFTSRSANEAEDFDEPIYDDEDVPIPSTEVVVGISNFIEQVIPTQSGHAWRNHTSETLATVDWELSTSRHQYKEDYIIPTAETVTSEIYRINYTNRIQHELEESNESDEQPYDFSENSLEDPKYENPYEDEEEDEDQEPLSQRPQTRDDLFKKQHDIQLKINEFSKLIECRRQEIISKLGQDFFKEFYTMCKSAVTVISTSVRSRK